MAYWITSRNSSRGSLPMTTHGIAKTSAPLSTAHRMASTSFSPPAPPVSPSDAGSAPVPSRTGRIVASGATDNTMAATAVPCPSSSFQASSSSEKTEYPRSTLLPSKNGCSDMPVSMTATVTPSPLVVSHAPGALIWSVTQALSLVSWSSWASAVPGAATMAAASASVPIPAPTAALARLEKSVRRYLRFGGAGSRGVAIGMAPSVGEPILRCPLCPTRYRTSLPLANPSLLSARGSSLGP